MSLAAIVALLGAAVALSTALALAWAVKRAVRERFQTRYGGSAGPVWVLAAALVGSVCLGGTVRCLVSERQWLDQCVQGRLLLGAGTALSPPYWSVHWLSAVVLVLTVAYVLGALAVAWLVAPPGAARPGSPAPPARGLPPASAAPSAAEPARGAATALDEVAGGGVVAWLYLSLGYWRDPRSGVEPRYRLWLGPLVRDLAWLKWLSLPLVGFGVGSAVAWASAALLHDALTQLLALPALPGPETQPAAEPEAEGAGPARVATGQALLERLREAEPSLAVTALGSRPAAPPRHGPTAWPSAAPGDLLSRVLRRWRPAEPAGLQAGFRPYAHQHAAVELLQGGEDVLLATAPWSGRTTICELAALDEVLSRGGTVLWIAPRADVARRRASSLRSLGETQGLHWAVTVGCLDGEGPLGIDPLARQPAVLVASVDALETHLMPTAGSWDRFFASLSLVVATHLDAYDGPRAAGLGGLARRLMALSEREGEPPRWLVTASGLWPQAPLLAESLAARSFAVVGDEEDGAPEPAQAVHAIEGAAEPFRRLGLAAESAGWSWQVLDGAFPFPPESRPEAGCPSPGAPLATFVRARAPLLPHLSRVLRHVPAPPGAEAVVLWLVGSDPLSATLLGRVPPAAPALAAWVGPGPTLADGLDNPVAAGRDFRRTLSEREASRAELVDRYGEATVQRELPGLVEIGSVSERRGAVISQVTGLPRPVQLLRLSDPSRPRATAAVVTDDPVALVEAATRQELLRVDRVRAAVVLHPGAILTCRGRRYRIGEQEPSDPVVAEPEPEPLWSVAIRTASVAPLGWRPRRLVLGGSPLELGLGPVALRFVVLGVRRLGPTGLLVDERELPEPRSASYEGRALVLRFAAEEASAAATHGVVHLVRACLPLVVRAGAMDLEVVALEPEGEGGRGLAIVDLHPFGAGFAEAVAAAGVRRLLSAALEVGRLRPDAAAGPVCLAPREAVAEPDPAGAAALLGAALG